MKKCWKCHIEKEETEFFKDRTKSDGLNGKCKVCQMEYFNVYIQKNAKKFKKLKAEWYRRKRASKHLTSITDNGTDVITLPANTKMYLGDYGDKKVFIGTLGDTELENNETS